MRRIEAVVGEDSTGQPTLSVSMPGFKPGDRVVVMAAEDADEMARAAIGWAKPPPDATQVYAEGAAEERASIVAWLREAVARANEVAISKTGWERHMWEGAAEAIDEEADAIARGEARPVAAKEQGK